MAQAFNGGECESATGTLEPLVRSETPSTERAHYPCPADPSHSVSVRQDVGIF
jgi:hypothetical protein